MVKTDVLLPDAQTSLFLAKTAIFEMTVTVLGRKKTYNPATKRLKLIGNCHFYLKSDHLGGLGLEPTKKNGGR